MQTNHPYSADAKKINRSISANFEMRQPSRPESPQNPNTGGQYFDRRGEVSELKQMLRSALSDRDAAKMGEAIRKVIGYMTLGIDMSRVFSEMVMASQMGDTVQKKMIYLYLTAYAEQNAELAILAVNTLQKDTKDVDPSIRGLALRSLCSLRLPNFLEYLEPAVECGLLDSSVYVRKTAVMGILKLSNHSNYTDRLFQILGTDFDTSVISNCLVVLKEMNALTNISQSLVYQLLNKFSHFSEWTRCVVIDTVLSQYIPCDSDELFTLMNCMDPYLKQSSVPVSIGVMKLFLTWSAGTLSELEILERIKDPILTLLSSSSQSVEMQYAILKEIVSFGKSHVFADNYMQFFLADFDTIETGKLKIEILSNFHPTHVIPQLSQYIADPHVGQFAVDALVKLAIHNEESVSIVFETLLNKSEKNGCCIDGLAALLARFPQEFAPERFDCLVDEIGSAQISSIVWILGEFGEQLADAPYILELIHQANETDPVLQITLLSAAVKLFFKRPVETRNLLETLIRQGIDEAMHPDLHDRALLYYRVLQYGGIHAAKRLVKDEVFPIVESSSDILLI